MFYNRRIESEHRRRAAHPSAGRPHNKKVGERIHGACKRRPHARLISARTIRNRRLWLECLRLRRFSRLVQTTLLADSALTTTSYGDSPISRSRPAQATPTLSTLLSLSRQGIWSSAISMACIWDPTPAMSTTVLSLAAAVRFSTAPPSALPPTSRPISMTYPANEDWLIPYCEFMTVKEECGLKAFWEWPAELRTRGELPPRSAPTIRRVCSTTR